MIEGMGAFTRRGVLAGGLALTGGVAFGAATGPIARTRQGALLGARVDGAVAFKGVPYAGETARFMAPAPLRPWTGTRPALELGPMSAQPGRPGLATPQTEWVGSEQCQVLNVWTPALDRGRRPVMVWLHGGGFQFGSANDPRFDGAALARTQDVVLVSVNHRLGAFGQLWLGHLDGRYLDSGVAGFLDIVAALRWVRDNIASFGGDPNRVTIFGQSGGGGKVLTLLGMPAATPLFHRAIVQSGSQEQTASPREEASRQTEALFRAAGVRLGDVARLASLPTQALIVAQLEVGAFGRPHPVHPRLPGAAGLRPYSGVLGAHLPEEPFGRRVPPFARHIPLMIGSTTKELRQWAMEQPELYRLDEQGLRATLAKTLGDRTDDAIAVYRKARPAANPSDLYWAISADDMYWAHSLRVAGVKARDPASPVFSYRFAFDPDEGRPGPTRGAGHGQEVPLIFGNLSPEQRRDPNAVRLSIQMGSAWARFARDGRPSGPGLPAWPAYDLKRRATMNFSAASGIENDPGRVERLWWESRRAR